MTPRIPTQQLPKSARYPLQATCWLFEKRYLLLAAFGALFMLFGAATLARAGCNTIPVRQNILCDELGYEIKKPIVVASCDTIPVRQDRLCDTLGYPIEGAGLPPCDIQWETDERGRYLSGWGVLTLISDTDVDEPLTGSAQPTTATVLHLKPHGQLEPVIKIHGVTNPDYNGLDKLPSDAPCTTPGCTLKQGLYGLEAYTGLDEWALLDVINILNKSLWHPPDPRFAERMREASGATGLPIGVDAWIPKSWKPVDETKTELASELRFKVRWLFALPAK